MPAAFLLAALLCAPSLQEPGERAYEPVPGLPDLLAVRDTRRELPLRLEDVVRLAVENAPAIRQAHLQNLADLGAVESAEGVFDPLLNGDLSFTYSEVPTAGGLFDGVPKVHARTWRASQGLSQLLVSGGTLSATFTESYTEDNQPVNFFGINPQSDVAGTLTLTQPLLRGAWELNATRNLRSAELGFDRNLAGLRHTQVQTLQAAVDAYWDLAFALRDVEVKEFSLELGMELRDVTLARYRAGTVAQVDVVQAEADIASRAGALLSARNSLRQAEDALRNLVFRLQETEEWELALLPVSEPPAPEPVEMDWRVAWEEARKWRADLRQARVDVEQSRLDWEVARRNLLPTLDLNGSITSSGLDAQVGDAFNPVFDFVSAGWSLGLSFEVPLGNRTARGAEQQARIGYFLALRRLHDLERDIQVEVRDAVRNLNFLAEQVKVNAKASEVARRQLDAEQRRLEEGASTNFQVLQFQEDLINALTAEQQSKFAFAKAWSRLNTVRGLGWDGTPPDLEPLEDFEPRDLPVD